MLRERDSPARIVRFSMRHLYHAALDVLPSQPEALFRSVSALQQDGDDISQQERILRLDWSLASFCRSYSRLGAVKRRQQSDAQRLRSIQIHLPLRRVEHAIPMGLTRNHPHPREHLVHLTPFDGECEHPAKHLKLSIDAGYFQAGILPASGVPGDLLSGYRVETSTREQTVLQQACGPVFVIRECLRLGGKSGSAERKEVIVGEFFERGGRRAVADANFTFR